MNKPLIIITTYNRPNSLARLLHSLSVAEYKIQDIELIISIDYCEAQESVIEIANSFSWEFGQKTVVTHESNLGLRKHMIKCFKRIVEHGSGILLEDDLIVSPQFYNYTCSCLNFFENDGRISGISLYEHYTVPFLGLPFLKIEDGYENYFLQFPSSWGQAWTAKQLANFLKWYEIHREKLDDSPLPPQVRYWSDKSWLKYYAAFLLEHNLFFVYPRKALTSNFSDAGTHIQENSHRFQIPMLQQEIKWRFVSIGHSNNIYDSYFEIKQEIIKKNVPELKKFEFTVNLWGSYESLKTPFVLVHENHKEAIYHYSESLKPISLNILQNFKGSGISLLESKHYKPNRLKITPKLFFYHSIIPLNLKHTWAIFKAVFKRRYLQ